LPFITNITGKPSTDVLVSNMTRNFVISNYASTWPLDHDDGSCYYHDTHNFLVWAGAKNYLGQAKVSAHNVYVHVEANGMEACAVDDSTWLPICSASGKCDDNRPYMADVFANNTCITASGNMYHYSRCDPSKLSLTTDDSFGNKFLSGAPQLNFSCGGAKSGSSHPKAFTLESFQAAGHETDSTRGPLPSAAEIAALGRQLLGLR
jgi:hypothetical protein